MGFFDKVKKLKNMVTGGGAKVGLSFDAPSLNEPFKVNIQATIDDTDLDASKIYLKMRAVERIHLRNIPLEDGKGDYRDETQTFATEFDIAPAQSLKAGETYEWSEQIQVPQGQGALPSYNGHNASHEWEFFAGLDVKGNDPDSGWIKIDIS